jgi:hypothetical protein
VLFAGLAGAFLEIDAGDRIDGVLQGHGLAVLDVNRLAFGQPHVIGVNHLFRALFGADPAADAFGQIHVAGMLPQNYRKIARLAGQALQFRKRQKLDV